MLEPSNGRGEPRYFTVSELDVAAARIADLGGRILVAPLVIPSGSRILVSADPQGAVFALFEGRVDP